MSEQITLSREDLEHLIDQRAALVLRRGMASADSDDPLMAEAATAQRRSFPDSPKEQMAQVAKIRGGLWSPDNPDWRKYGGMVQGRDGQLRAVDKCPHLKPKQCDHCWTPETEQRWAVALGLSTAPCIPLDEPEELGQGVGNVERRGDYETRHGRTRHTRSLT